MGNDSSKPASPVQPVPPPICADVQHSVKEPSPPSSPDSDYNSPTDGKDEDIDIELVAESQLSTIEQNNTKSVRLPICDDIELSARKKARRLSYDYTFQLGLGHGYTVAAAYDKETDLGNVVARDLGQNTFRLNAAYLLLSMNKEILRVAMTGNLPLEILKGRIDSVKQVYRRDSKWMIRSTQQYAPAVYIRYLVNRKDQQSPTPAQYKKVGERLIDYVSGNADTFQQAVELDNVRTNRNSSLQSIREGQHWYLQGSISRVKSIWTFCEGLARRIDRLKEEDMDQPLQHPLGYLGYSINPDNRLKEHERENTSWLHHLVLNAFRLEFGDATFEFSSVVLCYLADPIEALVAEPIFILLTDTNIETGGGFNITQGGVQTTSSRLPGLSEERRKEVWQECKVWRETHTDYNTNYAEELHRLRDPEHKKYVDESCLKYSEALRERERKEREEQDAKAAEKERIRQNNIKFLREEIKVCEGLMEPDEDQSQEANEHFAKSFSKRMEYLKAQLVKQEAQEH